MVGLPSIPSGVAICRNQNRDKTMNQKLNLKKNQRFGVATIAYFGKLRKNQKDKTRSVKNQILGLEVGYAWGRY